MRTSRRRGLGVRDSGSARPRRRRPHGEEGAGVGHERGLVPAPATTRPAIAGPAAEPTVNAMFSRAFPSRSWPAGASSGGGRGAGQRSRRRRERAVDGRQDQHRGEQEVVREQGEDPEASRLGGVESGSVAAPGAPPATRPGVGRAARGEVHPEKQGGGRHRAVGLVEDEHRERDLAQPVPDSLTR